MRRRLLLCLLLCLLLAPAPPIPPPPPTLSVPDAPDVSLPAAVPLERLARDQPLAFLEQCVRRYRREVHGFRARLLKHERIGGQLQPEEEIDVAFHDPPYRVLLRWRKGARNARAVLYAAGASDGKLLALPAGIGRLLGVVSRDPDSPSVRSASRYSIKESGLLDGTLRTLRDWKAAQEQGTLHVEYLGMRTVPQAGNRPCYTLRRRCAAPEEDGFTEVLVHFDKDTLLQVGSVMTGPAGLYGAYYFRDIELNPDFPADQFEHSTLVSGE